MCYEWHLILSCFPFCLFGLKFVFGRGFLKGFSVTWSRANLSFSSGLLLFGLHVTGKLSDGQKKNKFFDFVCMCKVSFINLRSKAGGKERRIKVCFIFFSIKLCLCDKVNFGLVKDSICCNETSDLSKLIIKQTYIISLHTFFFVVHFVFFPSRANTCVNPHNRLLESKVPLSFILSD